MFKCEYFEQCCSSAHKVTWEIWMLIKNCSADCPKHLAFDRSVHQKFLESAIGKKATEIAKDTKICDEE